MIDREEPRPGCGCAGGTTMLQLVQSLAREGLSECDVVSLVHELVERGQVTLIGNFRDTPLEKPSDPNGGSGPVHGEGRPQKAVDDP